MARADVWSATDILAECVPGPGLLAITPPWQMIPTIATLNSGIQSDAPQGLEL